MGILKGNKGKGENQANDNRIMNQRDLLELESPF